MERLRTPSGIKKAVILAGGQKTRLHPLDHFIAPCLLSVLNRPLLTYTLDCLKRNGIEEVVLSVSEYSELYEVIKNEYASEIRVDIHVEDKPRGTAGALKDVEGFIGDDVFIVINGSVLLEDIALNKALDHFHDMNSVALVGVYQVPKIDKYLESIKITNGNVESIHITHPSVDKRSPWRSAGIYIFDPVILKFIGHNVYMDLKEQLIPALRREALTVSAYEIEGCYRSIGSINDYFVLQRDILLDVHNKTDYWPSENKDEVADRVWIGENVTISPTAYLLGPVVVGDDCTIDDWAQVIGPAVVGNRCRISSRVLFRESILHDDVLLSRDVKVEGSVIFEGSEVPAGLTINNMIVTNGMKMISANLIPLDYAIKGIADLSGIASIAGTTHVLYKIMKRSLDLIFSVLGFVFLLPLFVLIAIAIKAGSAGPVFYMQDRCGKDGSLFKMIKFRTMVTNAEKLHQELIAKKDTDGPMFKMLNDPRVTKIGGFLRKTSLDEIPQLINVIKGEMSLVGPRPLIMDEMKFSPGWRNTRLKVKPGITGLWQIQGRSEASFHDWIRYDMYYVKNQSFLLDITILFKTIGVVLKKVGAY